MKKFTALAGVLLLSSSVLVACTPNAAPKNNAGNGTYDTTRGGRVMDIGDNNRVGIRGLGTGDQDRLGVRDNLGPDRPGANLRNDRTLESRVESIPGVRNATVLIAGNTAYVAIDQGTNLNGKRAGTMSGTGTTSSTDGGVTGGIRRGVGTVLGIGGAAGNAVGNAANRAADRITGQAGTGANTGMSLRNNLGGPAGTGSYVTPTSPQSPVTPTSPMTPGTSTSGTTGTTYSGTPGTPGSAYVAPGRAGTYSTGANKNATNFHPNGAPAGNGAGILSGAGNTGNTYMHNNTDNLRNGSDPTGNRAGTMGAGTTGNTRTNNVTGTTRGYNVYSDASVSNDIKDRVATIIRQSDTTISKVYVSANPGLMNRMDAFVRNVGTGHPIQGGNDLLDTVRRMFPASR